MTCGPIRTMTTSAAPTEQQPVWHRPSSRVVDHSAVRHHPGLLHRSRLSTCLTARLSTCLDTRLKTCVNTTCDAEAQANPRQP